jgi:sulfotransferase
MFGHEVGTVYKRAEEMVGNQFLGPSLNALRQAWYGDNADRLVAIRYDSLAARPAETISQLYEILGEIPFEHDFEHLSYEEPEFDARRFMPGLHTVGTRVEFKQRRSILPPELFRQYDQQFWEVPGNNPGCIRIL